MRSLRHTQRVYLRRWLSTGDALPAVQLRHASPGDLFTISESGRQIVVGVPAAFSPGCSNSHIPGYRNNIKEFQNAGIQNIHVISVNDAFVMNAWSKSFKAKSSEDVLSSSDDVDGYIKFLADHDGAWTRAADIGFDASKILGNYRSKRFAALIEAGKVKKLFIEPDNTGITVSSAENVLKEI